MKLTHRRLDPIDTATLVGAVRQRWRMGRARGANEDHSAAPGSSMQPASASWAHPVFVLGVNQVLEGQGPEAASEVGLRVLVDPDGHLAAAAEVAVQGVPRAFMKPQLSSGVRLRRALADVESQLADDSAVTVELRALRVPSLYVDALWAHNDALDLFYLLETDDNRLLERDEFVTYLRQLAASSGFGSDAPSLAQPGSLSSRGLEPA